MYSNKNKKFIALILARGNSKGIKEKNLIPLWGKPLIYWSIKRCLQSKHISSTWVSSDSSKILRLSKKFGAKIIDRPSKYALDKSSSESSWMHAIKYLNNNEYSFSHVVAVQPTSPLRDAKDFDDAIVKFKKNKLDSMFSANRIYDHFVWNNETKKLIPNYNYKKRPRRQEIKNLYLENGSFFIFDKKKFINKKNRFFGKIGFYVMDEYKKYQIDNYHDLEIIKNLKKYSSKY
mgnify:CR=1 FL=1